MTMHAKIHRPLSLTCALWLMTACAPVPPTPVLIADDGTVLQAPPPPDENQEQVASALADRANKARAAGQAGDATKLEDELLSHHPGTEAAAIVFFARGRAAQSQGKTLEAVSYLEKLQFYRPHFFDIEQARSVYAKLLFQLERYEDAANMLGALYASATTPASLLEYGQLYIRTLRVIDRPGDALRTCVDLHSTDGMASESKRVLGELATELVSSGLSFNEVAKLWKRYENDARWRFIQPMLGFKLAKIYYHTRDYDQSGKLLASVIERFADTEYGKRAATFQSRLESRFKVNPTRIGVILPLSGRFAQYGKQSLAAIQMAFKSRPDVELVVRDTEAKPTTTSKVIEELVLKSHVIGIIGPLFTKEAIAAAQKAEELSVPLVSLSYRPDDVTETGDYVFRSALTIRAQAKSLAKFAFEELGISRFALLYPRTTYARAFIEAFWDEVDARKGEIRGIESYEHDETTFREPVRKLVGRWYRTAREDYQERIKEIRELKLPSHRERAAIEKFEKNLPPIVDFDAIVIPDTARRMGLIAPALAFEDIVMTRDERELKRIKKATGYEEIHPITLLGASTWNKPQLRRQCQRYCENAVFVDGYFSDNPSPLVRDFDAEFRAQFKKPPQLVDAQAFDTGGVVRHILDTVRPTTRDELRRGLLSKFSYQGVTGTLSFDQTGEVLKELFVLTLRENTIQLYQSPEESPQG